MLGVQTRVFFVAAIAIAAMLLTHGPAEAQIAGAEASTKSARKAKQSDKPTVAVLYFDYSGTDEELSFLRKGLAQMLVTDLSKSAGLQLVERTDLEAVLQELKLNRSNKINRKSANQIGKLLGARYLVTGGYFVFRGRLRVDAKVIDVERGTTKGVGALNALDDFLALEAELAKGLEAELVAAHKASTAAKRARRRKSARVRKKPKPHRAAKANSASRANSAA